MDLSKMMVEMSQTMIANICKGVAYTMIQDTFKNSIITCLESNNEEVLSDEEMLEAFIDALEGIKNTY